MNKFRHAASNNNNMRATSETVHSTTLAGSDSSGAHKISLSERETKVKKESGLNKKTHTLASRFLTERESITRMQRMLLLLRHASKCSKSDEQHNKTSCSLDPHCASMKKLWKHISSCRLGNHGDDGKGCQFPNCSRSRYALWHFKNCANPQSCPVCGPVRMTLAKQLSASATQDRKHRESENLHSNAVLRPHVTAPEEQSKRNASAVISPTPNSQKRQKISRDTSFIDQFDLPLSRTTGQKSALTSDMQRACSNCLHKLQAHEHGWVFSDPVDPELLGIPDYFEVIKHPMDLGTVERRLRDGSYKTFQDFKNDTLLVFDNALQYNQDGSVVYNMAKEMKRQCLAHFAQDMFNKVP